MNRKIMPNMILSLYRFLDTKINQNKNPTKYCPSLGDDTSNMVKQEALHFLFSLINKFNITQTSSHYKTRSQEAPVPWVSTKPAASKQVLKFVAVTCQALLPGSQAIFKRKLPTQMAPEEEKKRLEHSDSLRGCVTHEFLSCMNLGPIGRHQEGA